MAEKFWPKPPWYKRLFLKNRRLAKPPPGAATRRTLNQSANWVYQNGRLAPLKIEFADNDHTFKHTGSRDGHGLNAGCLQIYRVAVHNTTSNDIQEAQVWLTDITPVPPELRGQGALPLHFTHEAPGINTITLTRDEKRFVDVVSFIDKFWNPHIRIEHTSSVVRQEIYKGDDGYEIELVAKGNNVKPFHRRFKIGVNTKDLYMVSLDQPAEEAFQEGFNTESKNL